MRISFLEHKLSINGSIRRVIELANRLTERGHAVTIYTPDSEVGWLPCAAPLRRIPKFITDTHEVIIFNRLTKTFYDLIDATPAATKVFLLVGMPEGDQLETLKYLLQTRAGSERDMLFYDVLHNPDMLTIAAASWMSDWLRRELNINIELAAGGVNTEMFRPVDDTKWSDIFHIISSGDPRKHKGFDTVKAAMKIVMAATDEPVHFSTYWGKGIPQSGMAAALSSAHLFVDGQTRAGWSNPVAEAMACGVPVVCTDIGGNRDFARPGVTALVVPPDDAQAMAAAMLEMIQMPNRAQRLADAGLAYIQQFDYGNTAARVEMILERRMK